MPANYRNYNPGQKEYRDFGDEFLDNILQWIAENLPVEAVVSEERMIDHIRENTALVAENFDPEDIFNEKQLRQWAKENGYVEEEC